MSLRVVAAAIRTPAGMVYSLPPPARHHDVVRLLIEDGRQNPPIDCQGFLLSDGRFCRRKPAKIIATKAGQLLERASKSSDLFSEDVW